MAGGRVGEHVRPGGFEPPTRGLEVRANLSRLARQGAGHQGPAGSAAAHGHGLQRSLRRRPLLRLHVRHAWRSSVGLAARRTSPLEALHRRGQHALRRAVLPRRVANPRSERISLGREGLPDDGARGRRRSGDRALARPRAPQAGRVLAGVSERPCHAERRPGETARASRHVDRRSPVCGTETGGRDHPHVPFESPTGDGAKDARARRDGGRRSHPLRLAGGTRPGVPHYYRLQGPTFLLEFDNSRNSGTHIHSVWRDFERDFGTHLL